MRAYVATAFVAVPDAKDGVMASGVIFTYGCSRDDANCRLQRQLRAWAVEVASAVEDGNDLSAKEQKDDQ